MILVLKVPKLLENQWISWAEKSFSKKAHCPSIPIKDYFTERKVRRLLLSVEIQYMGSLKDFLYENKIHAFIYNEAIYVHPAPLKYFVKNHLQRLKLNLSKAGV